MSQNADDYRSTISDPRFRTWRLASQVGGTLWLVLFVTGLVMSAIQGDGRFMKHPLTMIAFGIMASCFGILLVWQPRTYVEYLRLNYAHRIFTEGPFQRVCVVVAAFFSGILFFVVGICIFVNGLSRL